MILGQIIFYVADIEKSLQFFNRVFDIETKFIHESGAYAEMLTGTTTLAFVDESLAATNLPDGLFKKNSNEEAPLGCELVFNSKNVDDLYKKALENGAKDIASPHTKPWGQTVGYIRDPNGILIEIATPIS